MPRRQIMLTFGMAVSAGCADPSVTPVDMAAVAPPAALSRFAGTYVGFNAAGPAPGWPGGPFDAVRIGDVTPTGYTAEVLARGRVLCRLAVPARYAGGYLFVAGERTSMDHGLTVLTERSVTGLGIDALGRLQLLTDARGVLHLLFVFPVLGTHDCQAGTAEPLK